MLGLRCRILLSGFARITAMPEPDAGVLRNLRNEDVPAAFRLSAQAGWNQTEDDWRTLLDLAPEGCLAIEVDGQLAATTTVICYGQRLAWIGMILTRRDLQRRGFARRLMNAALQHVEQMKIETVKLDATDQGRPLYEQYGFCVEREIERWALAGAEKTPAASKLEAAAREDGIWREADAKYFGGDRLRLLDRLAQRNSIWVDSDAYLFARPGRLSSYLGPCVSENLEGARRVIKRCLESSSRAWIWDLFPGNGNAVAIARDAGFTVQRHLVRMSRGRELCENTNAIYAIAGFELG